MYGTKRSNTKFSNINVFEKIVLFIRKLLNQLPSISEILTEKFTTGGFSKTFVAAELGVTEKTIENYMNGKRQPKHDRLVRLAAMLGFGLSDISTESEQNVLNKQLNKSGALPGQHTVTIEDHIALLKSTADKAEQRERDIKDLMDKMLDRFGASLNALVLKSHLIQAGVEAGFAYQIEREAGKNQAKAEENQKEFDRRYGAKISQLIGKDNRDGT